MGVYATGFVTFSGLPAFLHGPRHSATLNLRRIEEVVASNVVEEFATRERAKVDEFSCCYLFRWKCEIKCSLNARPGRRHVLNCIVLRPLVNILVLVFLDRLMHYDNRIGSTQCL